MLLLVMRICLFLLCIASLLSLRRLLIGPTIVDRIIAFDMTTLCVIGMMALLSTLYGTSLFIEIMIIFSLLGFVGTIAFVSYLHVRPNKLRIRDKQKPIGRRKKS